jgi:hypothetical protein
MAKRFGNLIDRTVLSQMANVSRETFISHNLVIASLIQKIKKAGFVGLPF